MHRDETLGRAPVRANAGPWILELSPGALANALTEWTLQCVSPVSTLTD